VIPWSAPVMGILVWVAWQYLGGKWHPYGTACLRRRYLRARAVPAAVFAWALFAGALSITALAGLWIVMTQIVRIASNGFPDSSQYPLLTFASMVFTGSLIGPLMEQAGFWGYGQAMLEEEFHPSIAIAILSVVFAVGPHPPTGAIWWPKVIFYFLTSVTFGCMAFLTKSILPGVVIHAIADLIFFTAVWPYDGTRPLVGELGMNGWFWLHAAQAIGFTALAAVAFVRLASITSPVRADGSNSSWPADPQPSPLPDAH